MRGGKENGDEEDTREGGEDGPGSAIAEEEEPQDEDESEPQDEDEEG